MRMRQLACVAAAAVTLTSPALAQTTLTYSSWVPPTHHLTIWQANWAAEVEKATGGRVKFQSLPKHPAAAPGTFDAVRDGLVDLSYVTASYTPARHILPLMAELPGMADTAEVNSVAYSRIHWQHFQKVGEYKGVKLLAVWTHGPGQMFTKKPVAGINDVRSLKIRTGGGIAEAVANAIGASAFVKPAPESYELLNSGVADGVFFPFESIVSFKLDTVIGQATVFPGGMYSSAFGFFMNEEKWNKLSKQDQAIIEKYSYEYAARSNGKSWDAADQKGLDALKKASVKIVRADPAFVAEVQKRSGPIVEDWIKKASAKGVDARAALQEFRAEIKKVAAKKWVASRGLFPGGRAGKGMGAASRRGPRHRRLRATLVPDAGDVRRRRRPLPLQPPHPRRVRGHRAPAAGADLRRAAAGVARRRARHDGLHRPHAARGRGAGPDPRGPRGGGRGVLLSHVAGDHQGRPHLGLRRHHRRAAHRDRAVRLFHGGDDRPVGPGPPL